MVDPNVFAAVGVDPERYSGFAFGFGIDRLAQVRIGLVRHADPARQRRPFPRPVLRIVWCAPRSPGFATTRHWTPAWPSWPTRCPAWGWWSKAIERVGAGLGDVVVARVAAIRAHPDADRIRLVDVDARRGEPLQIVCGAWNFAVGDLVPLAPVGAVLPGDLQISRRKMRGQWSNGMLCSGALELPAPGGPTDGLLILAPGLAAPGTTLVDALELRPDVVFDLDISPTAPTPCAWQAWPATWLRRWASPGSPATRRRPCRWTSVSTRRWSP